MRSFFNKNELNFHYVYIQYINTFIKGKMYFCERCGKNLRSKGLFHYADEGDFERWCMIKTNHCLLLLVMFFLGQHTAHAASFIIFLVGTASVIE